FIFTIDTRNTSTGSTASDTFKLPLVWSFSQSDIDCTIDWGDGAEDTYLVNDSNYTTELSQLQHTYTTEGIYQITVKGTLHLVWSFANSRDKLKMLSVEQWGSNDIGNPSTAAGLMYGCANLSLSATVDGLYHAAGVVIEWYRGCTGLTSINNLHLWSSGNWGASWGINSMFRDCVNLDEDFSVWDFTGVESTRSMNAFMFNVTLSIANYNSTLISMAGRALTAG